MFSVVQDIDEAKAGYASLKTRLPAFGRTAEDVMVLPGVMPVVGRTDKEAFEKLNVLQSFVSGSNALAILSDRFGRDMLAYDLDGPIPDIARSDSHHSFASVMLAKGRRENMTLRDLYNLTAAALFQRRVRGFRPARGAPVAGARIVPRGLSGDHTTRSPWSCATGKSVFPGLDGAQSIA